MSPLCSYRHPRRPASRSLVYASPTRNLEMGLGLFPLACYPDIITQTQKVVKNYFRELYSSLP